MEIKHIGRYEIQRRLGIGGMGALYLARDPILDRLVAIRLPKDDFQDDPRRANEGWMRPPGAAVRPLRRDRQADEDLRGR